jgi:hypothetical protein
MSEESSYHGNINLKPIGHKHNFTFEQLAEIEKCQEDPIYFIENYCMIVTLDYGLQLFKLYDCQKEKVKHILENRKAILMEGRQQGKTITSAACILWYTLFQDSKTVAIMANKTAAAREVMARYQGMYENLPLWMQQGVKTWNKGDVELENGSKIFTAATTASGIRGKSVNWLYIDEAAIIPNTVAEQFFASVYPTISAGQTTKILLTSTPLGYNHFWKFWNEAEKGNNGFVPMFIPYHKIPGRDEAWAEEQLRLLGELKFNQEVLCEFLGSSNTLVSAKTLGAMSSIDPIHTKDGLDIFEEPIDGHIYAMGVDTARGVGGDYSAFTVLDVTEAPYKLVAKYRDNKIAPMLFPNIVAKVGTDYNKAYILVEINDIGQQVADILHMELEYDNILTTVKTALKQYLSPGFGTKTQRGVRMTKQVKRQGCFALKSLLEEQKLLVFDAETISEFSTFIEKQGSWQADEGYFDDLVMSLVLLAWMTSNPYFKDMTNVDIRERMYKDQMDSIEDELTPFGAINNGFQEDYFVSNGDLWKVTQDDEEPRRGGWLL